MISCELSHCLSACGPWTRSVQSPGRWVERQKNKPLPGLLDPDLQRHETPRGLGCTFRLGGPWFGTPWGNSKGRTLQPGQHPVHHQRPSQTRCGMVPPSPEQEAGRGPAGQELRWRGSEFLRIQARSGVSCGDASSHRVRKPPLHSVWGYRFWAPRPGSVRPLLIP